MIDTWLLATFCFSILAICAFLRVIRGQNRYDRAVAAGTGITISAGAAIFACIGTGSLAVLDVSIAIIAIACIGVYAYASTGVKR
jgi:multisubunit Na+/H+ antiporter MnhF subunit